MRQSKRGRAYTTERVICDGCGEYMAWIDLCDDCDLCDNCCGCDAFDNRELFDADELGLDPDQDDERKYPNA